LAVPVAAVLVWDGWSADRAERYRLAGGHEARSERQAEYFAAALAWRPGDAELELTLAESQVRAGETAEGLRHLGRARNRGRLLRRTQVRLAAERPHFAAADPVSRYLERAALLLPNEPEVWIALGRQQISEGNVEAGAATLRRALEQSDKFLPCVLETA